MPDPQHAPGEVNVWQKGRSWPAQGGVLIVADEENGRRFFSYRMPGEWSLRQECSSVAEAQRDIREWFAARARAAQEPETNGG